MAKGIPQNTTAPPGIKNAIKLTELCAVWSKTGLHLTDRRYRQIAKEGRVPEPVRGYVDALKCLISISIYYQSMAEGKGDSTHEEIKKKRDIEKLAMDEMERKVMEGTLIQKDAVADELVKRTHMIKSDMLSLVKRLAKFPEAKEIAHRFIIHILKNYARKGGVFSE